MLGNNPTASVPVSALYADVQIRRPGGYWRADYDGSGVWAAEASYGGSGAYSLGTALAAPLQGAAQNGWIPAEFDPFGASSMSSTATCDQFAGTGDFTILTLAKPTVLEPDTIIYDCPPIVADTSGNFGFFVSASGWRSYVWDGAAKASNYATATVSVYQCAVGKYDGGNLYARVNAGAWTTGVASGAPLGMSVQTLLVGMNYSNLVFYTGQILELAIFPFALSDDDIALIGLYLEWRYNLTLGFATTSFTGTASLAFASFALSATGSVSYSGAASLALAALAFSATGSKIHTGTSSVALSPLALSSAATESFIGTGSLALSSLGITAAGNVATGTTGTATLALSPLALAATGAETFTGSATLALSPLAFSATGAEVFTGSVMLALRSLTMAATGSQVVTGTASVALSPLATAATGAESFLGTTSIALRSLGIGATGTVIVAGAPSYVLSVSAAISGWVTVSVPLSSLSAGAPVAGLITQAHKVSGLSPDAAIASLPTSRFEVD